MPSSFGTTASLSIKTLASKSVAAAFAYATTIAALVLTIGCGGSHGSISQNSSEPPPLSNLTQLSTDKFSNAESQHATEVEPAMFAVGSSIVTAFQVGRIYSGGSADIGFATSTDGGASWTNGLLSGITKFQGGTYNAATDPSVAYDKAHGVWLIGSLAITGNNDIAIVTRSANGQTWGAPITVSTSPDADKPWIVCDNTSASPYYGHCYMEWDDPTAKDLIWMSTSTDGGQTWSPEANTADLATGLGGQPLVQPGGTVIVTAENSDGTMELAFVSSDGGRTWSRSVTIAAAIDHVVAANLRTSALPSAAIDQAGTVYVVWQDCRFRLYCASNDIVMSTSFDGMNWTAPARVPIDVTTSSVDHFIPSLAIDPASSGTTAHMTLSYYFYPIAQCDQTNCQLGVGYVSSSNGGNSWTAANTITAQMMVTWLPNTVSGYMVGDYFATVYSNGNARSVFAVAQANSGGVFNEAIYTTPNPLVQGVGIASPMKAEPVRSRRADHEPRKFYDLDHEHPIPRKK